MNKRPAPAAFARIVANVATYPVGIETYFGMGAAFVEVWRPTEGVWVFHLVEVTDDLEEINRLKTVAVTPSEYRGHDVIGGDGTFAYATDFRGIETAIGYAFDELAAEVWRGSQNEHDPVAV
jgi:hypothetical protein